MKILQVRELAPLEDNIGGVEVCIMSLSRELVAMGREVTILCGARDWEFDVVVEGVRVVGVDFCGLVRRTWDGSRLTLMRQLFFPFVVLLGHGRKFDGYDVYHGHIYIRAACKDSCSAKSYCFGQYDSRVVL